METVASEIMEVLPPEPEREPAQGPADWVRRNLFRSVGDGIVTVVAAAIVLYIAYRGLRYLFVTGRWEIIRTNLKLFMVGRYPADELWRIGVAIAVIAFLVGAVAGFVAKRRRITGRVDPDLDQRPWGRRVLDVAFRLWPLIVGGGLIMSMTTTVGPWLVVAGAIAGGVLGRLVGPLLPARAGPFVVLGVLVISAVVLWMLREPFEIRNWGGLMLNLVLAVAGITLCFPLGLLLALGRRSKLPLIRWLSVATSSCSGACRCTCCSCSRTWSSRCSCPPPTPTRRPSSAPSWP